MIELAKSNLSIPILPKNSILKDYQDYLVRVVKIRGFENETITQLFMLFTEECGELAKALRKFDHIKSDITSKDLNLSHECADVFIYLLEICNYCGIDLEKAFREKEEINSKRKWK